MTNKIPTYKLSLDSVCKTEEEKQQVLRLMKSQGADAITINSKNEKVFTRNGLKLSTMNKDGSLKIHTNNTKQ
jgi:hypothetical protein